MNQVPNTTRMNINGRVSVKVLLTKFLQKIVNTKKSHLNNHRSDTTTTFTLRLGRTKEGEWKLD